MLVETKADVSVFGQFIFLICPSYIFDIFFIHCVPWFRVSRVVKRVSYIGIALGSSVALYPSSSRLLSNTVLLGTSTPESGLSANLIVRGVDLILFRVSLSFSIHASLALRSAISSAF